MNERIKALKEQAMRFAQEKCEGQSRDMYGTLRADIVTEKFAELIVRECVRYFNEDYNRDFDILWREDLSKGIRQHFGVEE